CLTSSRKADEALADQALLGDVFLFMKEGILGCDSFTQEEFYVRRLHLLITDFLALMPMKVKQLRNRADEDARLVHMSLQMDSELPSSLRKDLDHLMVLCSVPPVLKAELLHSLAAFGKSPEVAASLWQSLEYTQVELNEIESSCEEYPLTRAFCHLIGTLVESSVPVNLGAGLRVPGFQPYLNFLRDSVFLPFPTRAYHRPAEKVADSVLEVFHKLLRDYEPQPSDFIQETVELQGEQVPAHKPPGHSIMFHLLNDSPMLALCLSLLEEGVRQLDTYAAFPEGGDVHGPPQGEPVIPSCVASGAAIPRGQSSNQESRPHRKYCEVCIFTTAAQTQKLLFRVPRFCDALPFTPTFRYAWWEISHMIRCAQAVSDKLMAGFVECLDNEEAEEGTEGEDGVLGCPRSCLHAILSLLQRGTEKRSGPVLTQQAPHLAELCYQVIYQLCASPDTSGPTMRYLRTSQDFLFSHLQHLPFILTGISVVTVLEPAAGSEWAEPVLDAIDFSQDMPELLQLDFFERTQIEQVISNCEHVNEQGHTVCNVKEVNSILQQVVERNRVRRSLSAKRHALQSWRSLVETLLTACPADLIPADDRQLIIRDLLLDLFDKVLSEDAAGELMPIVAGAVFTLTAQLSQSVLSEQQQGVGSEASLGFASIANSALHLILRKLELFVLAVGKAMWERLTAPEDGFAKLQRENLNIIESYGKALMEVVCRDACDGHEISRMLALAVLDRILSIDRQNQWLLYVCNSGYLRSLVESLRQDDTALQSLLTPQPPLLKPLYIYESKMVRKALNILAVLLL
ncbi:hypothetical protein XENOCAPTIV_023657, partial [Xenoophorus captivus]